jgi:hypothetical protein
MPYSDLTRLFGTDPAPKLVAAFDAGADAAQADHDRVAANPGEHRRTPCPHRGGGLAVA